MVDAEARPTMAEPTAIATDVVARPPETSIETSDNSERIGRPAKSRESFMQQVRRRSKSFSRSISRPASAILFNGIESDTHPPVTRDEPTANEASPTKESLAQRVRRRSRSISRRFSRPERGPNSESDGRADVTTTSVISQERSQVPKDMVISRTRSRSQSLTRIVSRPWSLVVSDKERDKQRAEMQSRSSSRPQSLVLQQSWSMTPIEAVPPVDFERYRHSIIGLQSIPPVAADADAEPGADASGDQSEQKSSATQQHVEVPTVAKTEAGPATNLEVPLHSQPEDISTHKHNAEEASLRDVKPATKIRDQPTSRPRLPGADKEQLDSAGLDAGEESDNAQAVSSGSNTSSTADVNRPTLKQIRRTSDITTLPSQLRAMSLAKRGSTDITNLAPILHGPGATNIEPMAEDAIIKRGSIQAEPERSGALPEEIEEDHTHRSEPSQSNAIAEAIHADHFPQQTKPVQTNMTTEKLDENHSRQEASVANPEPARQLSDLPSLSASQQESPNHAANVERPTRVLENRTLQPEAQVITSATREGLPNHPREGRIEPTIAGHLSAFPHEVTDENVPCSAGTKQVGREDEAPADPSHNTAQAVVPTVAAAPIVATSTTSREVRNPANTPSMEIKRKPSIPSSQIPQYRLPLPPRISSNAGTETPLEEKLDRSFATSTFDIDIGTLGRSQDDPRSMQHPALRGVPFEGRTLSKQASSTITPVQDVAPGLQRVSDVPSTRHITDQFGLEDVAASAVIDESSPTDLTTGKGHKRRSSMWENIRRARTSSEPLAEVAALPPSAAQRPSPGPQADAALRSQEHLMPTHRQSMPIGAVDAVDTPRKRFSGLGSLFGRTRTPDLKASKAGKLSKKTSSQQQTTSPSTDSIQPTLPRSFQNTRPDYAAYEASRQRHIASQGDQTRGRHGGVQQARSQRTPVVFQPGHAWYNHFINSVHHYPDPQLQQPVYRDATTQTPYRSSDDPDGLSYHKVRGHGLQTDLERGPADLIASTRTRSHDHPTQLRSDQRGYAESYDSARQQLTALPVNTSTRAPPQQKYQHHAHPTGQQFQADNALAQPAYTQQAIITNPDTPGRRPSRSEYGIMSHDHAQTAAGPSTPSHHRHAASTFDFGFESSSSRAYRRDSERSHDVDAPYGYPNNMEWRHQEASQMRGVSYPGQEWVPVQT